MYALNLDDCPYKAPHNRQTVLRLAIEATTRCSRGHAHDAGDGSKFPSEVKRNSYNGPSTSCQRRQSPVKGESIVVSNGGKKPRRSQEPLSIVYPASPAGHVSIFRLQSVTIARNENTALGKLHLDPSNLKTQWLKCAKNESNHRLVS